MWTRPKVYMYIKSGLRKLKKACSVRTIHVWKQLALDSFLFFPGSFPVSDLCFKPSGAFSFLIANTRGCNL